MIILGLVASLVLIEPDLGTTVIICAAFSVFFVAQGQPAPPGVRDDRGGLAIGWWAIHAAAYRAERLAAFLDPWGDPQAKGGRRSRRW